MAWMEHGLQISLKRYALSMEDKMAAWSFLGALRIMGVLRSRFCRVLSSLAESWGSSVFSSSWAYR